MLLFDDSKRLEKALGEEAAAVIAHVFEKADENWRRELATKADLQAEIAAVRSELSGEIKNTKAEIIKWVAGLLMAQAAVIATLVKLLQ